MDPALLWLWPRPVAAALIRPQALELPHAVGEAQKKRKKKKKEANGGQWRGLRVGGFGILGGQNLARGFLTWRRYPERDL